MGKIYTFIHKGQRNSKVKTSDLSKFLDDGWEIGNWNQEELNRRSGEGIKRFNDSLRESGKWEEYNNVRGVNVSKGLIKFWSNVADNEYIQNREIKKQQ